ncbi:hypothetical protein [Lacibacter sp. H407]|uniref:hypothetical protein n=1 Tax=Lacibacter sp. H407 TaxID=3133423 RepID=UPI0030C4DD0D
MPTTINSKTVITSLLVLIIAVLVFFLIKGNQQSREDEQVAVKCSNKTVFRYKYPDQYFPAFTREYDNQVAVTSDFLKNLTDSSSGALSIELGVRSQIVQLQQQLNQDNITFSTGLRSYFMILNNDPCNDEIRNKYALYTEEMSRRMLELKKVVEGVEEIKNNAIAHGGDTLAAPPGKDTIIAPTPDVIAHADTAVVNKSINTIRKVITKNNVLTRRLPVTVANTYRINN